MDLVILWSLIATGWHFTVPIALRHYFSIVLPIYFFNFIISLLFHLSIIYLKYFMFLSKKFNTIYFNKKHKIIEMIERFKSVI